MFRSTLVLGNGEQGLSEEELEIRQLPTAEFENETHHTNLHRSQVENTEYSSKEAFLRVGFTHHCEIIAKCKNLGERWYYIFRCASEFWTVESLKSHIRADDYHHYGTLPNNFALTIPDGKTVARAVYSFKDEYLLDYINIEDEADQEVIDERVLNKAIVHNVSKVYTDVYTEIITDIYTDAAIEIGFGDRHRESNRHFSWCCFIYRHRPSFGFTGFFDLFDAAPPSLDLPRVKERVGDVGVVLYGRMF